MIEAVRLTPPVDVRVNQTIRRPATDSAPAVEILVAEKRELVGGFEFRGTVVGREPGKRRRVVDYGHDDVVAVVASVDDLGQIRKALASALEPGGVGKQPSLTVTSLGPDGLTVDVDGWEVTL